jgi:hypothetical protein
MRRLFLLAQLSVLFVILAATFGFPQQESLTISTYYPAPYGVYREFTTYGNTTLAYKNGTVSIANPLPDATVNLKLNVNGTIKVCDTQTPSKCGILQVKCDGVNCYAVYAD